MAAVANVNMTNMLVIAINTRDVNTVKEAIATLPEDARMELNVALEQAVANYMTDLTSRDSRPPGRSIGGLQVEFHNPKNTLEIIQLLLDNGASTPEDDVWSQIQMNSRMNPYVSSHRRELIPLIFMLRQNLDKAKADEFFGMVSDIAEEFMTPEELRAVLENSNALAHIVPELLPESLKSVWNRRGNAIKTRAMYNPDYHFNMNYNGNGGARRRHKSRNRRTKKRKVTRRHSRK